MQKWVWAAVAASVSVASPASAAFVVTPGTAPASTSARNAFQSQLASLGFTLQSIGASISLSSATRVTFEFLGSESGFNDSFSFAGNPAFTETSTFQNNFAAPVGLGSAEFGVGLLDFLFSSAGAGSRSATNGGAGLAVFLPAGALDIFTSDVVYFGFDDSLGFDDDFDDFLIRARIAVIPEPATWAMMIGGFGLAGAAVRRSRRERPALARA